MPKTAEKRKPKKRKKNESLDLMRKVTDSMSRSMNLMYPGIDLKEAEGAIGHAGSGFMSQWMGEDPESGEIVNPLTYNIKRAWNADDRRRRGLPPQKKVLPGIVHDTMSIPAMFGGGPEWAQEASAKSDRIHSGVQGDMGLDAPRGFTQNVMNAAGTMGAQLPIPASQAKAAGQMGKGALNLIKHYGKKLAVSPWEFLSPTVEPKMSNYVTGSLAGGALGTLGDEVPPEELPPPRAVARAEGGKVGALKQVLRALSVNPDATARQKGHLIGDPVEEVLYATNEGVRRGVLTPEDVKQVKDVVDSGDENSITEALLNLQAKLFPAPPKEAIMQRTAQPPEYVPPGGRGTATQEEWDAMLSRKQSGKSRGGLSTYSRHRGN